MKTSRLTALLISVASFAPGAPGAPPDIYTRIGHVVWLVDTIDGPLHAWSSLGLSDVHDFGKIPFQGEYRGRPITGRAHMASGHLGSLAVDMLEPQGGESAFNAFLSMHGDGIFSIVYEMASKDDMAREVARMGGAGVQVLQRLQVDTDRGPAAFTFFDTEPRGKYVLGLVHWPGAAAAHTGPVLVSHIAFVIRDAQPVSDYWQQIGFPAMPVAHASPREDSRYHGMPLLLPFEVGWHKYTQPTFEWIVPPQEPANCYADFLKVHGEGIHHLGLPVDDLDGAIARYKAMGYAVVQSGAWGDVGKKGSGRYGYMATDSIGGVTVELIHAYN
ncbi:MAG TPA: VOC family protein [Bryobacteraceae bacterium]|nr:VOC family protein [Bryobacteraceae bacterium]